MDAVIQKTETPRETERRIIIAESALWLVYIVAMVLKGIYFQFTTGLNTGSVFGTPNFHMLLSTLISILLPLAVLLIFFNRKRLSVLVVIDIIMTALLFADTQYFRYYYNAITIPVLHQIGFVSSIGESVQSLLKWQDLIFVADIPILAAGIVILIKLRGGRKAVISLPKRLICSAIVLGVCFGLFQVSWSSSPTYMFAYDNNYVIDNLGILYFHYYDVKNYVKDNLFISKTLTAEEKGKIDAFYNGKEKKEDTKYYGAAKGKNLIVVQMEAMQQFVINKKFRGQEITPNLNKFINDSAYFDNFFYQTGGGNTADAEFLTNTSLYPLKDGAVYFRFPENTYDSTAKLLKKQGYGTYAVHGYNPSFWNREAMYKTLGFDRFISSNDFIHDDIIGWGLSDKSMFRQALDKIDTSKPFYSFFITLSSHYPFNYFDNYNGFNVGNYEGTFLGDYLKAAHYVDEAMGQFLDELKSRGLYDNSVIVVYGDHQAFLKDQANLLPELFSFDYNNFNWTNIQKTPCFIRFPGMDNKGQNDLICGELDIQPTIANLLGFDAPHAMGFDMFNTQKGYAVLRNSTVVTDDWEYVNTDGNVYDNTGKVLPKDSHADDIKAYQDQLAVSDIILKKNALKSLN